MTELLSNIWFTSKVVISLAYLLALVALISTTLANTFAEDPMFRRRWCLPFFSLAIVAISAAPILFRMAFFQ